MYKYKLDDFELLKDSIGSVYARLKGYTGDKLKECGARCIHCEIHTMSVSHEELVKHAGYSQCATKLNRYLEEKTMRLKLESILK
jgi:hypothetical protein